MTTNKNIERENTQDYVVFVAMPLNRSSDDLYAAIGKAAEHVGQLIKRKTICVRADSPMAGANLATEIGGMIQKADVFIADLSGGSKNVLYELGWAHAQGIPTLLLSQHLHDSPSMLQGHPHLVYDPASIGKTLAPQLTRRLVSFFLESLETTGRSKTPSAKPAEEAENRTQVFISYSHRDKACLDRILVHLRPLEKNGIVDLWADTKLHPGQKWKAEIRRALSRAKVAVLLVSADFLATNFPHC